MNMKQNLIPACDFAHSFARRDFLATCGVGLGAIALQAFSRYGATAGTSASSDAWPGA